MCRGGVHVHPLTSKKFKYIYVYIPTEGLYISLCTLKHESQLGAFVWHVVVKCLFELGCPSSDPHNYIFLIFSTKSAVKMIFQQVLNQEPQVIN